MWWEYELYDHTPNTKLTKNQNSCGYGLFDNHPYDTLQTNNQSYYKKLVLLGRIQTVEV
jgi:hypothetical protein